MKAILVSCCAFLAGCAATNDNPCASAYERGHQEALMGMRPNFELYAKQCGAQPAAESDYMSGWSIGYSEWNNRVSGSRI